MFKKLLITTALLSLPLLSQATVIIYNMSDYPVKIERADCQLNNTQLSCNGLATQTELPARGHREDWVGSSYEYYRITADDKNMHYQSQYFLIDSLQTRFAGNNFALLFAIPGQS